MGFLRNFLEEKIADVNPWDNGKTGSTIRAARSKVPPAQTITKPKLQMSTIKPQTLSMGTVKPRTLSMGTVKTPNIIAPPARKDDYTKAPTIDTRAKSIQHGINQKQSLDQISNKTGLTKQELSDYTNMYAKGYGAQKPWEAVGSFIGDTVHSAAGIVRKPITTAMTASDPNAKRAINDALVALNRNYKSGVISNAKLREETNKLVGDQIGSGVVVDENGIRQGGRREQSKQSLLGGFQQGIDTSNVLPIGNVARGAQFAKGVTSDLVKDIIATNTKQALVYGTTSTANDLVQGRGLSPTSLAMNYGAPALLGSVSELGGGIVGKVTPKLAHNVKNKVQQAKELAYEKSPIGQAEMHPSIIESDRLLRYHKTQYDLALMNGQKAVAKNHARAYRIASLEKQKELNNLAQQIHDNSLVGKVQNKLGETGQKIDKFFTDPKSQSGSIRIPDSKFGSRNVDPLISEAKKYKSVDEFIYNNGLEHPEYKRRVLENQKYIDANRGSKDLENNLPYPNPDKGINREADLTALYNQANGITGKLGKETPRIPTELEQLAYNIKGRKATQKEFMREFDKELTSQNLTRRDTALNIQKVLADNNMTPEQFHALAIKNAVKPAELPLSVPKVETGQSYETAQRINYGVSHGKPIKDTDWRMVGTAPGDSHDMIGLINSKTGEYKQFDIPKGDYSKPTFEKLKQQAIDFATGNSAPQVTKTGSTNRLESISEIARNSKNVDTFWNKLKIKGNDLRPLEQHNIGTVDIKDIKSSWDADTYAKGRGIPLEDNIALLKEYKSKIKKIENSPVGRSVEKPILVKKNINNGSGYRIYDGNHRYLQALKNGDKDIPVIFLDDSGGISPKEFYNSAKSQVTPAPQVTKTEPNISKDHKSVLESVRNSKPTDNFSEKDLADIGFNKDVYEESRVIAEKAVNDIFKANSFKEVQKIHDEVQAKLGETVGDIGYLRKGVADAEVYRRHELVDSGAEPSLIDPTRKQQPPTITVEESARRGQAEFDRRMAEATKSTPQVTKIDYRSAHQIDTNTSRNLGDISSVDDIIGQVKSKYGLTNYDQKDITNLKKIIGNPESDVKIYRASPLNEINSGDWVTTSKTYANDIKAQNGGKVYEYTVKAKDLNLPKNIEDNPSLARFSAFQYNKSKVAPQVTKTPNPLSPITTPDPVIDRVTAKPTNKRVGKVNQSPKIPQESVPPQTRQSSLPNQVAKNPLENDKLLSESKTLKKTTAPQNQLSTARHTYPDNTTNIVKNRGFTESVKNSLEVSPTVKKGVSGEYNVRSTDKLALNADKFSKGDLGKVTEDVNLRLDKHTINDQDIADSIAVAKRLDGKGKFTESQTIYDKLAEHGTKGGQAIQAFSLLQNRTPDGVKFQMLKNLKKAGVELKAGEQKEVQKLIEAVRKTKPNTDARDRALFNTLDYVSRRIPTKTSDKLVNFWRAGLLTAPKTTGGNILGNTSELVTEKVWANPIAVGTDKFFSMFTGKRTKTLAGGATKGFNEGLKKGADYMKTGFDPRNIQSKYDAPRRVNYNNKIIDKYVNGVYKWMGAQDQPFYYSAKSAAAHDLAKADGMNLGYKGEQLANYIEQSVGNENWKPQTFKTAKEAVDYAKYAVYQNDTILGNMASGLKSKAGNGRAIADFILPFTQVPSSIAMRIIDRTPIGIAKEIVTQVKNKSFDQRAMAEAIGNGTFGIPVIAAGVALATAGNITGAFPTDSKERKLWDAEGKQAYSVKVGDRWYSLNYMQPFGTLLAVGKQVSDDKKAGKSDAEAWMDATAQAAKSIESQSFLQGLNGVLSAVNDPQRSMGQYVKSTASSVMPNFIRSGAIATDNVQRETKTPVDALIGSIPGVRQSLPVKQNMYGADLPARDNFLNQYANPLKPSRVLNKNDAATKELRRLQDIGNGIVTTEFGKTAIGGVSLTDDQVRDLNKTVNTQVKEAWDVLVTDDRYIKLPDEDKTDILKKVKDTIGNNAKVQFITDNSLNPTTKYKTKSFGDIFGTNATKPTTSKTSKTTTKKTTSKGRFSTKKGKFDYKLFGFSEKSNSDSKDLYDMLSKVMNKRK